MSVAISGDTIVVGDSIADEAQVFIRDGSEWTYQATLSASTPPDSSFGTSVSIDGDTVLIGASSLDANSIYSAGRAYVYQRTGTSWTIQSVLAPDNPEAGGEFGIAVDLDGDLAVIGALTNGGPSVVDSGSAYIFARSGNSWQQEAWLAPEDLEHADYFGTSVAIEGGTVVVGAWMHDFHDDLSHSGAAYVFSREQNFPISWGQTDKFTGLDISHNSEFGWSVDILDDTIMVGAKSDHGGDQDLDNPKSGSAYIFQRNGNDSWNQVDKFYSEEGMNNDWFGFSVALGHQSAVVGTHFSGLEDPFMTHTGSAYFYCGDWNEEPTEPDCPGDATGDYVVDVDDILAVINAWGSCPECAEDVTGDGVVNVDDVLLILSNFGEACP